MSRAARRYLAGHRAHDVDALLERWQAVVARLGGRMEVFSKSDGEPLYVVETPACDETERGGYYVSTGVHGDEAAAPWGLLEWVERRWRWVGKRPFVFFPCLNPWGLRNNRREDGRGIDLNRRFDHPRDRRVKAWERTLGGRRFDLALCLHEDYDGCGAYVYEHGRDDAPLGARLIGACSRVIPADPRGMIDGRKAAGGIVRVPKRMPKIPEGMPEAIRLHKLGCRRTLTLEMPSEFSLYDRVRAFGLSLDEAFLNR